MPRLAAGLALALAGAPATADDTSDEARIRAATRDFVEAYNGRDLERLLSYYADDYVDVNLPQPRQSKAQRRLYLSSILERGDTTLDVLPEQVIVSGAYAVVRGTIRLRREARDGSTIPTELRYMELMRRFPQGWKAVWGIDAEIYGESR